MKKLTVATIALLCGVAFTDCAAKKPVQPQPQVQTVDPQQARLDSLRKAAEIKKAEAELRKVELEIQATEAQAQAELEIAQLQAQNAKKAIEMQLGQKLHIPCVEESYDKEGEYMAGLGIAEGYTERGAGIADANRNAIADITSRYIGMIKNSVSQYAKNVNARSGQKIKENKLEGEADAIGTKLINKYANAVCRGMEQANDGTYTCYVAVQAPLKELLDETIDELGVIQTDLDQKQYREYMQSELDKQAKAAQEEKEQLLQMRKAQGL